jgi:hypothetical protein
MLTNMLRWLRRRVAGPAVFPDEYRPERLDAGWHPEYSPIQMGELPVPFWVFATLPR